MGKLKTKSKAKPKAVKASLSSSKPINPFGDGEDEDGNDNDDDDDDEGLAFGGKRKRPALLSFEQAESPNKQPSARSKKRRKRWDNAPDPVASTTDNDGKTNGKKADGEDDALDAFMEELTSGAMGSVVRQETDGKGLGVSGSSGNVITPDQLTSTNAATNPTKGNEEEEEKARRQFIEALKSAPAIKSEGNDGDSNANGGKEPSQEQGGPNRPAQLASEVRTEKKAREDRLKELEREAEAARTSAFAAAAPEFGRLYNDAEGGVMEEAERTLNAARAAPNALEVLAELNKKKELKAVDHSMVDYIPFKKNIYIVPRSLAKVKGDELVNRRAKLKVRVRGQGAPAPVSSFGE